MSAPTIVHCPQCGDDRRVASIMGGNYVTLSTCGHLVPIVGNR